MWTYRISNINQVADLLEVYVEFTPPNGNKFTKMYSMAHLLTQEQINEFISNEINKLEAIGTNYELLSNMLGSEFTKEGLEVVGEMPTLPSLSARIAVIEDILMGLLI